MADAEITKKRAPRKRVRATKKPEDILKDSVNQAILEYARRHSQSSVADIGKAVGLERDTTQKRLNKLTALGALQRHYKVDLEALGFRNKYRMDIYVDPLELGKPASRKKLGYPNVPNLQERLARKLLEINEKKKVKGAKDDVIIEDVAVLMGDPADLCATVLTKGDQRTIFDFVTLMVRQAVPGIRNTQTCIEAWSMSRDKATKEASAAKQRAKRKAKRKRPAVRKGQKKIPRETKT